MHPLAKFLKARGMSQGQFAEMAGVSRTVINRVLSGDRPRFSVPAALAIEAATDGAVDLRSLVNPASVCGKRRSSRSA
jgi:transcriptional regulator with XRE-family HTH domain